LQEIRQASVDDDPYSSHRVAHSTQIRLGLGYAAFSTTRRHFLGLFYLPACSVDYLELLHQGVFALERKETKQSAFEKAELN
jgi:hypothetical protein